MASPPVGDQKTPSGRESFRGDPWTGASSRMRWNDAWGGPCLQFSRLPRSISRMSCSVASVMLVDATPYLDSVSRTDHLYRPRRMTLLDVRVGDLAAAHADAIATSA